MEQLVNSEAFISVVTKSKLVLRDIDLFKQMKNVEVALSMSFMDENLHQKLEPASSSIKERVEALKELKANGIKTILFVSPIIPEITDFKELINQTKDFVDEYWFDKLNLRSSFKTKTFKFIENEFPHLLPLYNEIYNNKNSKYFDDISKDIDAYCIENNIEYKNFFAGT